MAIINVCLDLPEDVRKRLEHGEWVLDGSVVVDATTHRVMSWLEEAGEPRVDGFSDAVRLAHLGLSILLGDATERRMSRIEQLLDEVLEGVRELLDLSVDERKSSANAAISDLKLRLRRGVPIDVELARELHRAEERATRMLSRLCTTGLERARDEGSFLKFLLVVPGIIAEQKADRRAGAVGVAIAAAVAEMCAISFSRGVALQVLDPSGLDSWESGLLDSLNQAASGLVRAACVWYGELCPWLLEDDGITPEHLLAFARRLPSLETGVDHRRCPDEFVTAIQSGLCQIAALRELATDGGLEREVARVVHRVRYREDFSTGRRWIHVSGPPRIQTSSMVETIRRMPGLVDVHLSPFGMSGIAVVVERVEDARLIETQLRAEGFPSPGDVTLTFLEPPP